MKTILAVLSATTLSIFTATGAEKVISGVPAYIWYHGCEPTSIGMIMGYWANKGYTNLFTAQGDALYSTINVQDQISSLEHNAKYDPTPDNASLPIPPKTSIADFLGTSVDLLGFGVSDPTGTNSSIIGYAAEKGYTFTCSDLRYSSTWSTLVNEVNAGRPMLFYVDSSGLTGSYDHLIPVIGYDENYNGDGEYYACYTTANENEAPVWKKFRQSKYGGEYSIYSSITINPGLIPTVKLAVSNIGIKQPQNLFGFTITGLKNYTATVEVCTDLTNWSPLGTCLLDNNGQATFTDTNWGSFTKRFYRVK